MSDVLVHELELIGDVSLRVEERGDGLPIVLLHGFTGDASTMGMLAEPLASSRRVLVPDLIGHGGSTSPHPEAYGVDEIVGQLLEMLDELGVDGAVDLVGYSMGGRVGLTLACRHPLRVRSLTLIGASAGLATEEERRDRRDADEALARSIEVDGLDAFVDRWMANPLFATQARLGEDRLAEFRAQRLRNDGAELARSLRAAGTGSMEPLHDAVPACPVPTTLVVGADDPKFQAIAEDLRRVMPDATVATVDNAGHAAHVEQPEAVLEIVEDRLRRAVTVQIADARLPLVAPLTTAAGVTDVRHTLLFGLTDDGATGWGEAAPLPGWSPESLPACRAALPTAMPAVELDLEPVLSERTFPARAAVIGAALDLRARQAGRSLREHLAATYRRAEAADRVAVNGVVSATDPEQVAVEVASLAERGIGVVKLKVAALDVKADTARIAAARAAAPGMVLRLDANGGWSTEEAVDALRTFAPHDIALCEEPVRGVDEIAAVGAAVEISVAVDESVRGLPDTRRVWAHAGAISTVVIKPQAIGGDDFAMVAIAEARRAGVDVIVTTMIDSAVGVAHAAHVAAAAALPGAHGLDTSRLLAVDVATPLPIIDGEIRFPDEAGLGIGAVSPGGGHGS
ncbi:MAG: 2-succinyl-6-hydroxy-2,4-cyclohexadiene-1-carboxylate synthase [Acidimicrobiales bacterium]|nr:2-succinyl-6-hydroxy-2,4-cyclohexadiene-1-carboxylate synthase [Acidimicrobiales bacterium]